MAFEKLKNRANVLLSYIHSSFAMPYNLTSYYYLQEGHKRGISTWLNLWLTWFFDFPTAKAQHWAHNLKSVQFIKTTAQIIKIHPHIFIFRRNPWFFFPPKELFRTCNVFPFSFLYFFLTSDIVASYFKRLDKLRYQIITQQNDRLLAWRIYDVLHIFNLI